MLCGPFVTPLLEACRISCMLLSLLTPRHKEFYALTGQPRWSISLGSWVQYCRALVVLPLGGETIGSFEFPQFLHNHRHQPKARQNQTELAWISIPILLYRCFLQKKILSWARPYFFPLFCMSTLLFFSLSLSPSPLLKEYWRSSNKTAGRRPYMIIKKNLRKYKIKILQDKYNRFFHVFFCILVISSHLPTQAEPLPPSHVPCHSSRHDALPAPFELHALEH